MVTDLINRISFLLCLTPSGPIYVNEDKTMFESIIHAVFQIQMATNKLINRAEEVNKTKQLFSACFQEQRFSVT